MGYVIACNGDHLYSRGRTRAELVFCLFFVRRRRRRRRETGNNWGYECTGSGWERERERKQEGCCGFRNVKDGVCGDQGERHHESEKSSVNCTMRCCWIFRVRRSLVSAPEDVIGRRSKKKGSEDIEQEEKSERKEGKKRERRETGSKKILVEGAVNQEIF